MAIVELFVDDDDDVEEERKNERMRTTQSTMLDESSVPSLTFEPFPVFSPVLVDDADDDGSCFEMTMSGYLPWLRRAG